MAESGTLQTTLLLDDSQARLEIDAAELKVVAGPDRGHKVALPTDSLIIGSGPTCGLVLHDSTVSARHAEIAVTREGYLVRDLGSTNGLMLGAHRIMSALLADGMRLHLGQSVLSIKALCNRTTVALGRAGQVHGLTIHSLQMRALWAALEQLAPSDVTVLVSGETGTGKEVVAQALHKQSPRSGGPFVVFDCGAVTPHLMTAELFGYEPGAFTGASQARAGLLEEAEGGTLFIDEIAELSLDLQPMLLGVLERKRSRRIGGKRDLSHDIRVVAATHRNLAEAVRAGEFRQDLFYRLSVGHLKVPPLRDRREDLPLLIDLFARELGAVIAPEARLPLCVYEWPGNVRELRNTIAHMAARPDSEAALPGHAGDTVFASQDQLRALSDARRLAQEEFERRYLQEALQRAGGNLTHAAELAGITVRGMQQLAAKHGVRIRDRR